MSMGRIIGIIFLIIITVWMLNIDVTEMFNSLLVFIKEMKQK